MRKNKTPQIGLRAVKVLFLLLLSLYDEDRLEVQEGGNKYEEKKLTAHEKMEELLKPEKLI